jgi:hypothetical protein
MRVDPVDERASRRRFEQSADDLEDGRLAGPVRPDEANNLTRTNLEGDVAQRRHRHPCGNPEKGPRPRGRREVLLGKPLDAQQLVGREA